jgi:CRP/FNR family transcriptional regulator
MQTADTISPRLPEILDNQWVALAGVPAPQVYPARCRKCSLPKSGYFCSLSSAALSDLEAISNALTLREHGVLFTEGQPTTSVAIICEGQLKLTRSSRHGKTLIVRFARAGEALGISAALANLAHEVTATAIEPVHFRSIPRQAFLDFIRKHGEGSMRAAENISREYRAVMDDAYRLALSNSIAGRVAHLLLEFAREGGTLDHAEPEINMVLKHEELAFKLGSTRESVTRVLNDLKRAGVLSIAGTRMILLKKDELAKLL